MPHPCNAGRRRTACAPPLPARRRSPRGGALARSHRTVLRLVTPMFRVRAYISCVLVCLQFPGVVPPLHIPYNVAHERLLWKLMKLCGILALLLGSQASSAIVIYTTRAPPHRDARPGVRRLYHTTMKEFTTTFPFLCCRFAPHVCPSIHTP